MMTPRQIVESRPIVTLDGQPARVVGWQNDFATVRTDDPNGPSCEFAWSTVERVIAAGGQFKS